MITPAFNEAKATQAAAYLLKLSGGKLNYMKLIKLLYNANRQALLKWEQPIFFDRMYSMVHGQVPSLTLKCAKEDTSYNATIWSKFIQKDGYTCILVHECEIDELSRAELKLLDSIHEQYKNMDKYQMSAEHHDPHKFPEWVNVPQNSRKETSFETLCQKLGFSEKTIKELASDYSELALIDN